MQTYKDVVAKFKEKNSKTPKTTWRYESWGDSYEQGGRVGYQSGQLVQPGLGRQGYGGKGGSSPTYRANLIANLPKGYKKEYTKLLLNETDKGFSRKGGELMNIQGKKPLDYLADKYKIKRSKIKDINSAILDSLNQENKLKSADLGPAKIKAIKRKINAMGPLYRTVGGTPAFHIHEMYPVGGDNPIRVSEMIIISKETNSKLSPYDKSLNNYADEVFEATQTFNKNKNLESYKKSINKINEKASKTLSDMKQKLPKNMQGFLGWRKPSIDNAGDITFKNTGVTQKSNISVNFKDEFFKDLTQEKRFELKKQVKNLAQENMSNIKSASTVKLLKKMGYKCNLAKGAGESVACYMDDVKKTRADMKSPNVEVRAKAFAKQSNAFKIAKKLPKIGKWLSTAFKVGKTGLSTAVGSVTGGYGGVFLEGLLEGGFYDNARRKGYSPEQAEAETFTYRLAREGLQGKSTKDVPWYGGSEKLREKELIGDPQQNPKVAQYVDALKEQDRIYEAIGAKEEAKEDLRISEENFDTLFLPGNVDEASADVQDLARSGAYRRVDQTLKPGSMASQAYNTAVENRDALDQRRRRKYLEKFNPDALKREEKILSSPKQLEKRYEAMEKYKKNKADIFGFMPRKEYEKYQKEYDELKNISYEDIPKFVSYTEFLKSKPEGYDKTYGELYPTPASRYDFDLMGDIAREGGIANMAAGGRIGFKLGGFDKGRRAFMKWLAGITGATIAGGTGLIKLGSKTATKVVPKVTEEVIKRGADGTPLYIADLIKVVKAKGIKKMVDSNINKMPDTVHSYKGVDIVEDAAGEATRIKKPIQWGSDRHLVNPEIEMSVTKGKTQVTDEGLKTQKSFKEADEFEEVSVMPDRDGKMRDVDFYVDDKYHLEFEGIANEAKDLFKVKKASGGLASYDNYLPGADELY